MGILPMFFLFVFLQPFTDTRKFTMKYMKSMKFFLFFFFPVFLFLVIPAKAGIHSFSVFFVILNSGFLIRHFLSTPGFPLSRE